MSSLETTRRCGARFLFILTSGLVWAGPAAAQEPLPDIPEDEKFLQGLTSVTAGSGARAFGMGGAFLARADDATAASWNPAGLSYLRRPELSLVGARNSFDTGIEGQPATDRFVGRTPDFAAFAYPIDLGPVTGAAQLSFQRVFSFRGTREIDDPDRAFATGGRGGFDILALGTGLRVTRTVRVGATFNRWFNGYTQSRVRTGLISTTQEIEYGISGWNLNLGAIWSPTENLNLGVVGKTPFTGNLRLSRARTDVVRAPGRPDTVTSGAYASEDLLLDVPGAVGLGASWRPISGLTLSADYTRTFWSDGRIHGFFVVPRQLRDDPPAEPVFFDPLPYPTLEGSRAQADTEQLRLGGEYVFVGERLRVPVRAGLFTDRQYFRSATGSAPRFRGFTLGTGIAVGPLLLDAAYVFEAGSYLDVLAEDGTPVRASTRQQRFFLSLIYRHGPNR